MGWAVFAGCILFVDGMLNVFWGLAAVLNDDVVTVGGDGVIVWDVTAWGWAHLLVGAVMTLTALGLFSGSSGARWPAIFFAMLNAILQIGIVTAFPVWSVIVIALDVIVIYQLTVRWEPGY
jgi:hypothetical protein